MRICLLWWGVFQEFGFVYATLDLEGFRSGKLNQVLQPELLGAKG